MLDDDFKISLSLEVASMYQIIVDFQSKQYSITLD